MSTAVRDTRGTRGFPRATRRPIVCRRCGRPAPPWLQRACECGSVAFGPRLPAYQDMPAPAFLFGELRHLDVPLPGPPPIYGGRRINHSGRKR